MHITEFTIEGLAGRKDPLTYKLHRDINIFFGLNGSGKTSLLRILHSALRNNISYLKNVAFRKAEVKFWVNRDRAEYTRSIEIATLRSDETENISLSQAGLFVSRYQSAPKHWQHGPQETSTKLIDAYLPTSRLFVSVERSWRSPSSEPLEEAQLDERFEAFIRSQWTEYANEVLQRVKAAQGDALAKVLQEVLTSGEKSTQPEQLDPETAFSRVTSFLERQDQNPLFSDLENFRQRYAEDDILRRVVAHIDEVERRIAEEMMPRDTLQEMVTRLFTGNKRIIFGNQGIEVKSDEDKEIGIHSLSSGEKHILRILIAAAGLGQYPMIIDEPEISMHVDWQRGLINTLRRLNPFMQIIAATHSPEIMAEIEDPKIFRI